MLMWQSHEGPEKNHQATRTPKGAKGPSAEAEVKRLKRALQAAKKHQDARGDGCGGVRVNAYGSLPPHLLGSNYVSWYQD